MDGNPNHNLNPMELAISELGPNQDCFIEIITQANSMVPEVGEYHAIIVTRYHTNKDAFVSAVINLEGTSPVF